MRVRDRTDIQSKVSASKNAPASCPPRPERAHIAAPGETTQEQRTNSQDLQRFNVIDTVELFRIQFRLETSHL